jgi:predicted TIM-barrel fold metal-dependent hydrolase
MQGLKKLLGGTSHIVFGTDFPYGNIATFPQALQTVGFNESEIRSINRDNALAILPKYRS